MNMTNEVAVGNFTNGITIPARALYDLMVEAHFYAAEVLDFHWQEHQRWRDSGMPRREPVGLYGTIVPDEFMVLHPFRISEIESYLKELRRLIEYVGLSVNDYIEISREDFERYATIRYKLK